MSDDSNQHEDRTVVSSRFEAYSSDIFPHHSLIEGYQKAIPNGGEEVLKIARRQQLFTFIVNLAGILTNNFVPLILTLPILFAIITGALIEVTVVASIPIGLFTAGSAVGRVVTTWRSRAEGRVLLDPQTEAKQLPTKSDQN
ncbi:MAG: hypothetical protein OXT68_10320 [Chloroflexota bacterium]|nr:hypothetical protein [Chloroflexota bacterium]